MVSTQSREGRTRRARDEAAGGDGGGRHRENARHERHTQRMEGAARESSAVVGTGGQDGTRRVGRGVARRRRTPKTIYGRRGRSKAPSTVRPRRVLRPTGRCPSGAPCYDSNDLAALYAQTGRAHCGTSLQRAISPAASRTGRRRRDT